MKRAIPILIADDSAAQRKVLELILKDCEVVAAENGQEALDRLETFTPELIILDLNMPFLTGLEVCRKVKTDERWRGVPVMLLTSQTDSETRRAALEARADLFMSKPVSSLRLREAVAQLLDSA